MTVHDRACYIFIIIFLHGYIFCPIIAFVRLWPFLISTLKYRAKKINIKLNAIILNSRNYFNCRPHHVLFLHLQDGKMSSASTKPNIKTLPSVSFSKYTTAEIGLMF